MNNSAVIQLVPKLLDNRDGVGTYAARLGEELAKTYGASSRFVAANDLSHLSNLAEGKVILHYVNYGYQQRGLPFDLAAALQEFRRGRETRVVTIFHELYASGPIWRSAFWLKPLQRRIARSIARSSDAAVITSETALGQLHRLAPEISVSVQPVPSGFGEPVLGQSDIKAKDPHRWVICGGTALVEKSIESFSYIFSRVPEHFFPRELFVIGGRESIAVREKLNELRGVQWKYHPDVDAAVASDLLASAAFGWLDYFHHPSAPVDALLKSSVFAAFCAHGIVPVLPHRTGPLSLKGDSLPGPFFIHRRKVMLPLPEERAATGSKFYDWYHRHASLKALTEVIGEKLGFGRQPVSGL